MSKAIVADYIGLLWREFEDKHSDKQIDAFLNSIGELEFDEAHLSPSHLEMFKEGDNRSTLLMNVRNDLREKDFSEEYITNYINQLEKARPSDILNRVITNDILVYFQYNNEKIKISDLRTSLDNQNLTTNNVDDATKKALKEQLKFYLKQNTKYENGLQSLLDELEETSPRGFNKITRRVSSITHIDPTNAEDRLELYDFYEERYPLYTEMKNSIREILTLWDRVEEEFEGENEHRKPTGKFNVREADEDYIEDLDKELEELKEIYNQMDDDLNYILKLEAIPFNVTTSKDTSVSENVRGLVLEKLKYILGKDASELIQEIQEDDDEFTYGEDELQTVGFDAEEPDDQPVAETVLAEKDEVEEEMDDLLQEISNINMMHDVDPLYVIASDSGILKRKYTIDSWERTRQEILSRLTDVETNNPGVISIYKQILDEHEEFKEKAFKPFEGEDFYLPATESSVASLMKYTDLDVNYEQIENLHNRLVAVLMKLLEADHEQSTYPIHMEIEDMAPGKEKTTSGKKEMRIPREKGRREQMFQNFNLFSRVKVGKKGKKREPAQFGKFAESLIDLFEIADRYYGDPIRELMLPYKSVPRYLDADTLSALINHGPENVGQLTLGLYRDYFIAFVTPRDLSRLTEYMIVSNAARKSVEDLEQKANGVLDVLENIVPANRENDILWFANEFKKQAKRDSSFSAEGVTLQNRDISEMGFDRRRNRTSYHQVLWLIYKFKEQFLKNPYTKTQMEDFVKAYSNQSDMKLASYAQTNILEAHDSIRKMLGKPIYYNTCRLDSFDHMNDTIDIVKENYNIEITSSDVVGIVNEFDTMETLAKKYGTKPDVIYHIKALYR